MKRLTILRHAKSSWDDASLADFNRPLNDRGWKAARRVGRELKRREIHLDLCVASTAARVRETLDGLVEGYGKPDFEIRFEPRIYEASLATLLEIVRGLPEFIERAAAGRPQSRAASIGARASRAMTRKDCVIALRASFQLRRSSSSTWKRSDGRMQGQRRQNRGADFPERSRLGIERVGKAVTQRDQAEHVHSERLLMRRLYRRSLAAR